METKKITRPREALLEQAFKLFINWRHHEVPDWPKVRRFRAQARDGVSVFGWGHCPDTDPKGSLLLLHGFTGNSGCEHLWGYAREISERYDFAVGACDFRHHGMSDDALPTFGMAESWDIEAVLELAETNGFPRPYVLAGESLGAMAAQISAATNPRVDAAFLMAPPAWPWQAIDHCIGHSLNYAICLPNEMDGVLSPLRSLLKGVGLGVCDAINDHYSEHQKKVLHAGCLFNHDCSPAHDPLVLYLMGTDDEYGIEHTRKVWGHWYKEKPAKFNAGPSEAPNQKKWMIEIEGAGHPGVCEYSPYQWEGFMPLFDEFINAVMEKKGGRQSLSMAFSAGV